jgi:undecaprenyl phosphate-alpha-L-ara4N flippase subunit ArnE
MIKSLSFFPVNNSFLRGYLFIGVFLLLNTANQIMFKAVALGPGGNDYFSLVFEPLFYLCGILFVMQAAVWLLVLRCLPLSQAYPFTSLNIVTLLASGVIFFGETVTLGHIFGTILIMAGVAVIASGNNDTGSECESQS